MVSNDTVLNNFADRISDLGFGITFDDISAEQVNKIGMYLTSVGSPRGTLSDSNKLRYLDLTLRIHGNTETGSIKHCQDEVLNTITKRLTTRKVIVKDGEILGSSLRQPGKRFGTTSKKIPVFEISFLITLN